MAQPVVRCNHTMVGVQLCILCGYSIGWSIPLMWLLCFGWSRWCVVDAGVVNAIGILYIYNYELCCQQFRMLWSLLLLTWCSGSGLDWYGGWRCRTTVVRYRVSNVICDAFVQKWFRHVQSFSNITKRYQQIFKKIYLHVFIWNFNLGEVYIHLKKHTIILRNDKQIFYARWWDLWVLFSFFIFVCLVP